MIILPFDASHQDYSNKLLIAFLQSLDGEISPFLSFFKNFEVFETGRHRSFENFENFKKMIKWKYLAIQ